MIHHERLRPPLADYPPDEWAVIEKRYHPEFLAQLETMMALGNGYLGMRGCPEEGAPVAENSTLINRFYENRSIEYDETAYGFAKTGQTICNVADGKIIKLFVDDEPFLIPDADILSYDRRLNMKSGTLDREIVWETPAGKQVSVTSRRLASFVHRHVAAISYRVCVLNAAASLVISSEVATNEAVVRTNAHDPRQPRVLAGRVLHHQSGYSRALRVILCHVTRQSRLSVVCGIDHVLETECQNSSKTVQTDDFGQVAFMIDAQPGCAIQLTKWIVYHTSATATDTEICGRAEWTLNRVMSEGFPHLLLAQQSFLDDFWYRSDVLVKDIQEDRVKRSTVEIQQAIRFNLFQILQASARAEDAGVPAKGLTGRAYEGHYFWDTEVYVLPFLTYTSPWLARNILRVRYKMLDKARARARELGHRGATFPWRTISGEEASAYYAAGTAQYHINADIAYAIRKYVNATGDERFLCYCGAEILVETARFWLSLGFYSGRRGGKFCINSVTGPDEYKAVVDNNAYTNLMSRENLRYAAETVEYLRCKAPEAYEALVLKTELDPSEPETWLHAAKHMYIPYDETLKIVPQDDSFLEREPWDFANTSSDHYPLLLFYHPLNIYRKQVIKQADVVLAMFLLGDLFSLEAKKRNFEFYDPLTTGDSSLSSCIEAIIATQIGDTDKALQYGMAALLMDLADVGGNIRDGCHIASMGGTWMMLVYGLGGLRDHDGRLSFWPKRAPEDNAILRFCLTYRGQLLEVEIAKGSVEYTLRHGQALGIRHGMEQIELTAEDAVATRSIPENWAASDHPWHA